MWTAVSCSLSRLRMEPTAGIIVSGFRGMGSPADALESDSLMSPGSTSQAEDTPDEGSVSMLWRLGGGRRRPARTVTFSSRRLLTSACKVSMKFLISVVVSFSSSDAGRKWPASLPDSLGGGDVVLDGKIHRAPLHNPQPTKITLPRMMRGSSKSPRLQASSMRSMKSVASAMTSWKSEATPKRD